MGRVFACTDLHGRKDLFDKINAILQEDDKVYFLGDAADRGPDGWEMIKMILNDNRFEYIKGNHEDMLAAAAKEYFMFDHFGSDCRLFMHNGGEPTFNSMLADPTGERWVARIRNLPTYKIYWNALGQCILLSHAGFTPWLDEDEKLIIPEDKELIWNRSHYLDDWDENMIAPDTIVVHGHSPIPYIMDDLRLPDNGDLIEAGPLWYFKNRKVCLDCAAFATGAAFLLDLDTFETITIRDTD